MDCPNSTIGLCYTSDEWLILEQAARMEGSDFRGFLNRKVSKLGKWAEGKEDALLLTERIQRKFPTPEGSACELAALTRHFNIPLASMVARLIAGPILRDYYEQNGILLPRR